MRAGRLALLCVVLGASIAVAQTPDVTVVHVRVTEVGSPWPVAPVSYFGQPVRIEASVVNQGDGLAQDFTVSVAFSDNATLSLLTDPFVGQSAPVTLAAGSATTVAVQALVPATGAGGAPLVAGPYWFFAIAEAAADPVHTNDAAPSAPHLVVAPAPDLVPGAVTVSPEVAAGEVFAVTRTLRNVGNAASPPAAYRYVLSANADLTEADLPLELQQPDGSFGEEGSVALAAGEAHSATEWIRLPASIVPGPYYLGVLVDPADAVTELDEQNNGAAAQPVTVVAPGLRLVDAPLPAAVVGAPYVATLSATGALGPVTWALTSPPSSLPEGLSVDPFGTVHGTPSAVGVWAITVDATDASGRHAAGAFVIRVMPPSGTVTITSTRLPPPIAGKPYQARLAAQGGAAPYRWKLTDGALPEGLVLGEDGELAGVTTAPLGSMTDAGLQVFDAAGNTARARFRIEVVAPNVLYVETGAPPEAQVGAAFTLDLVAHDTSGNPLALPLEWTLTQGRLPAGVHFDAPEANVWMLRGTPTESGAFPLALEVTDADGRTEDLELILQVHKAGARIVSTLPQQVLRESNVEAVFRFESGPGTFALSSGALPQGLALQPDGRITGTIAGDAALGRFTFTVAGRTPGGIEGLAPASMEVIEAAPPTPTRGGGCGSTGALELTPLAMIFTARFANRRRRGSARE